MTNISSLVSQVAKQIGVDEATANQAVASVIQFIQSQLGDSQFAKLLGQIPGAESMAKQETPNASGGMLGGLAQMAGSLLGGDAGDSVELAGKLKGLGLSSDQITKLATTVADFVQKNLGDDALAQIKKQIPALGDLLG